MKVHITMPRGFKGCGRRQRIVVQEIDGGIRMRRASTHQQALVIADAWKRGDYSQFEGELRVFPEQP